MSLEYLTVNLNENSNKYKSNSTISEESDVEKTQKSSVNNPDIQN